MDRNSARTPLTDWHSRNGARMVDFAGWTMPIQYTSIVAEHNATRSSAGVFDISHMGRLEFSGRGAREFLDRLVTRRVADMKHGQARYALVTNEEGGILDDVLVYCMADDRFLMVVNASNRQKIVDWIEPRLAASGDVAFKDITFDTAMIAVQGPKAIDLIEPLTDVKLRDMRSYTAAEGQVAGQQAIVSRTGYTGEDGCELIVAASAGEAVWQKLVEAGATPAGLGARDTLRLEAAMPLYGHELTEETDPFTAGLAFAVNLKDREFPGSGALAAIAADKPRTVRIGLKLDGKRVPREGYEIYVGDRRVGRVTSGTFSPQFDQPIAMGYVEAEYSTPGAELAIDIRGQRAPATVVELPFYRRPK